MRALVVAGVLVASQLVGLAPTSAAEVATGCEGLQAALNDPQNTVITLTEVCDDSYTLPSRAITLQGESPGSVDGFDRSDVSGRSLAGHNVGATVLKNLIFTSDGSDQGGGLALTGASTPTIQDVVFHNNDTTGSGGGLLIDMGQQVTSTGAEPAAVGVGPAIALTRVSFTSNTSGSDGGAFAIRAVETSVVLDQVIAEGNETVEIQSGAADVNESGLGGGAGWVALEAPSVAQASASRGGVSAAAIGDPALIVRDSTFNGNVATGPGGGLLIEDELGDGILLERNVFGALGENGNEAGIGGGLAVYDLGTLTMTQNHFVNNTAGFDGDGVTGGGLFLKLGDEFEDVSVASLTASGNTFGDNNTKGSGGGAAILMHDGSSSGATLSDNLFDSNVLEESTEGNQLGGGHFGGGLYIETFECINQCPRGASPSASVDTPPQLLQVRNQFTNNRVERADQVCTDSAAGPKPAATQCGYGVGGGGEWLVDVRGTSRYDQFLDNEVNGTNSPGDGGDAEGGGLGVEAENDGGTLLKLENAVVAGNSIDESGSGGGVYVGGSSRHLEVRDSTIVENEATAPAVGPGIGGGNGGGEDVLIVNSIVVNNVLHPNLNPGSKIRTAAAWGTGPDIDGFVNESISFTDACTTPNFAAGNAYPGAGNICQNPLLVRRFHEQDLSPTLDKGSNALVPPDLTTDIDGENRISDGDQNGASVVDMGADEFTVRPPQVAPGSIGEGDGYCMAATEGGVFAFGNCQFVGVANVRSSALSAPRGTPLNAPMVGMAMTPSNKGYWQAGADGGVFAFGDAQFFGSLPPLKLTAPIVGIASTPTGKGYWMVAANGAIFRFGDAANAGSAFGLALRKPIVAMAATPSGQGYWLVASDGGVFAYGDAAFFGSAANLKLNKPMVSIAARPGGLGYWLVALDGGVFAYGDAPFFGSLANNRINGEIVAIRGTSSGNGYWLAGSDGGVFAYGSAPFKGAVSHLDLRGPIVDMTG